MLTYFDFLTWQIVRIPRSESKSGLCKDWDISHRNRHRQTRIQFCLKQVSYFTDSFAQRERISSEQ